MAGFCVKISTGTAMSSSPSCTSKNHHNGTMFWPAPTSNSAVWTPANHIKLVKRSSTRRWRTSQQSLLSQIFSHLIPKPPCFHSLICININTRQQKSVGNLFCSLSLIVNTRVLYRGGGGRDTWIKENYDLRVCWARSSPTSFLSYTKPEERSVSLWIPGFHTEEGVHNKVWCNYRLNAL